jgi:transcriptional regulator with XRE-family HTH domain
MFRYDGQPLGIPFVYGNFATRNGWCQSHLSAVERGRNEVGAEVLLALSRESGRSIEWLLTGEE